MYLKSTITMATLLVVITANSQETPTISQPEISIIQTDNTTKITEISKNHVSSSITVHTYKLNAGELSVTPDIDGNLSSNSASIERMIDTFLSVTGVSRCTFDNATQTFTILSEPSVSLSEAVQLINN